MYLKTVSILVHMINPLVLFDACISINLSGGMYCFDKMQWNLTPFPLSDTFLKINNGR